MAALLQLILIGDEMLDDWWEAVACLILGMCQYLGQSHLQVILLTLDLLGGYNFEMEFM